MSSEKNEIYERRIGSVLDKRYRLDEVIGYGGMAVVYKATDLSINNQVVAIKMLKEDTACDEVVVKRFINECRAETMLKHRNIVSVHEVNVKGDIKYMVMEYVDGMTLKKYLAAKGKPLELEELLGYTLKVLRALHVAHEKGIIHRDIKPQNVMVLGDGKIKVMDFGIAKLPNTETVTVTDKAVGTVYYMSPEQASGEDLDPRSDIYSLGAMMYELATGEMPFVGESPVSILMKHIKDPLVPPRVVNPKIPVGLEQIIMCAMSKKPQDRFESVDEMISYVKQLENDPRIKFDTLPSNTAWENFKAKIKRIFSKGKKK